MPTILVTLYRSQRGYCSCYEETLLVPMNFSKQKEEQNGKDSSGIRHTKRKEALNTLQRIFKRCTTTPKQTVQ